MMVDDDWISLDEALACMAGIARHPDVALRLFEAIKAGEIATTATQWEVKLPYRVNEVPPEERPPLFGKQSRLFWNLVAAQFGINIEVEGAFTVFDPIGGNFDARIAWGQDDWVKFAVRGVLLDRQGVTSRFGERFADAPHVVSGPATSSAKPTAPRGRPPGSGLFNDAPLLAEMARLIEEDPQKTPHSAAWSVVDKADGGGDDQSKIRRLMRKYKEMKAGQ
jgi:hypothetical protein